MISRRNFIGGLALLAGGLAAGTAHASSFIELLFEDKRPIYAAPERELPDPLDTPAVKKKTMYC